MNRIIAATRVAEVVRLLAGRGVDLNIPNSHESGYTAGSQLLLAATARLLAAAVASLLAATMAMLLAATTTDVLLAATAGLLARAAATALLAATSGLLAATGTNVLLAATSSLLAATSRLLARAAASALLAATGGLLATTGSFLATTALLDVTGESGRSSQHHHSSNKGQSETHLYILQHWKQKSGKSVASFTRVANYPRLLRCLKKT